MSNAVARIEPKEVATRIAGMMDSRADQMRDLLGGDERLYERFRTVALHAVTSNPRLMESDPASIFEAIRDSATLGLEPNGLMGEGYVLPYRDKKTGRTLAQFQVGWRGLLKLIRRSNGIASIDAQCVYERDTFDVDLGSEPRVVHKPSLTERGNRVGAYAVCRLSSGELVIEWMPNAEIEMVRRSSKSKDNGPWVDWPDEMARKTVLKRIAKRLPLAHVAERALELEAQADSLADDQHRPTRHIASSGPTAAVQRVHERLGLSAGSESSPPDQAGALSESEGNPEPAEAGAGGSSTGNPEPAAAPEGTPFPPGADTPPARCDGFSPELGACVRDYGHAGNHGNKEKESWS